MSSLDALLLRPAAQTLDSCLHVAEIEVPLRTWL